MGYKDKPISADSLCPPEVSTDPNSEACYNYLREQYNKLQNEQSSIQKQLTQEQYTQLSLEDKITYMTNQIAQTQNQIQSLEIQIAANNIQIKLLQNTIQEKEDSIAVMKQEISVLEETVNKRITETYKYSFLNPFDLLLDSKSFSDILSKTKYLIATRNADVASLEDYSQKATALKREEDDLAVEQTNLQSVQDSILAEKNDLDDQKTNLQTQVNEKNNLLAQSEARSNELLNALRQNKALQAQYDAEITAYVNAHMEELLQYGFIKSVKAGDVIGFADPNTGKCSTGPHVHFGIDSKSSGYFSANVMPFPTYLTWGPASGRPLAPDGWNYPYVYSNAYHLPLSGSVIMTQDYHEGYAIDLSLTTSTGNAPVLAAASGKLYRALDTQCNQNYALIVQDDGRRTIYLHLK
jgi:peptidoglycan hydrolase CwlO-like protein